MKLSELVAFRNQLNDLDIDQARNHARLDLGQFKHAVENNFIKVGQYQDQINQQYEAILNQIGQFGSTIEDLKQEISELITETEKPYFTESYRLYEEMTANDSPEYILQRRPELSKETENFLISRIQFYTSWQFPAMIVRPGTESFIKHLVSYDPLYLIDTDRELLTPVVKQFNSEYQQRLRTYVVSESCDSKMLDRIPDQQFGFCLMYNFFSYKPLEIIRGYLEEIYQKLRPGGILALSFNDCNRPAGVDLCERNFACYMTGSLMESLTRTIGYEQVFSWHDRGPTTWLELRKPGTLTSLRGGQTLAKIKVDPKYAELDFLRKLALEFDLVSADTVNTQTADQLKETIIKSGRENLLEPVAKSK
jgi:SAM-dependent methyltransferase